AAKSKMERRKFLKGGMLAGAAAIAQPVMAQQSPSAAEEAEVLITDSCGSDYMVDVIQSLGFGYVCANPGSSFRGMQESIINYGESAVRAYKIAMTPPMAPVLLVLDAGLQEGPNESRTKLSIPKLTVPAPPQGEAGAVNELARLLVAAENPVLVAGRLARTTAAMPLLIELAET